MTFVGGSNTLRVIDPLTRGLARSTEEAGAYDQQQQLLLQQQQLIQLREQEQMDVGNSTQNISVNSLPVVSAVPSSTMICVGQTATLTASGASTYTWQPGSGTGSSLAVTPTVTTTYSVTGTATTNCVNTSMLTLSVSPIAINLGIILPLRPKPFFQMGFWI